MEHSNNSENSMHGLTFNLKLIVLPDIIKEQRVGWSADRWNVELHLYPANTGKISRFNLPFCAFAVAFQEITAPGHFDNPAEWKHR